MTDFVRQDSQYPDFPRLLCEWDAGFARSPEAARIADDFDLPTVVADAFGEYVLRLAATGPGEPGLDAALAAIEHMAESTDPEIQNCAVIGVLSRLDSDAPALVGDLGPAATALYRRWAHQGPS